jgi:hypothetical protein
MVDSQLRESESNGIEMVLSVSLGDFRRVVLKDDGQICRVQIDVQCIEEMTLSGMRETLSRFKPIIIAVLHKGVSRSHIRDLLVRCGYCDEPEPVEEFAKDFFDERNTYSFVFWPCHK